jgi:uncharacterized membrane protein YgaE (UPF0421/DUF939 family)
MTFNARVLSAIVVECVAVVVASIVLSQLDFPTAYNRLASLLIGAPVTLYVVWAILRERDDVEREQRG